MNSLKTYSRGQILQLTRTRKGEEKIGEKVQVVEEGEWEKALADSRCRFVLLGVAEDIGVRANYGRPGAATAFRPALESFLSQQNNNFLNAESILVLGEILVDDLMASASSLDIKRAADLEHMRALVARLDERVTTIIQAVVQAGKIPLVVGGGHNNAYGNIRGAAQALKQPIHVINCDPHLDFREREGRHSGNGFSYASHEGYLNRYAVFGMHEQYNNQAALTEFRAHPEQLFFTSYEALFVREELEFKQALSQCIGFVAGGPCGIELDLDAITNVPSSAKTSSGISPLQARQYVYACATRLPVLYLHIAEGAPVLSHIKADNKTGKLIAYLLSDFIKGLSATGD